MLLIDPVSVNRSTQKIHQFNTKQRVMCMNIVANQLIIVAFVLNLRPKTSVRQTSVVEVLSVTKRKEIL